MRPTVIALTVWAVAHAPMACAAVYDRHVTDSASWDGSHLVKHPRHKEAITKPVRFDDVTGEISDMDGLRKMQIIQRPDAEHDLVAVRFVPGFVEVLRIRGWDKKHGLSFFSYFGWDVFTGPCTLQP